MKIASDNVKDVIALSPMQESMLFFYLTSSEHEKYVAQVCYWLTGTIRLDEICKSWESVIEQNDILRIVFRWEKLKQPIQVVLKNYTADIQIIDLREMYLENMDSFIEEEMAKDRREAFDITKSSYRIKLYPVSNEEAYMLMSSFSIIYDGWSNSIMLKEFLDTYNRLVDGNIIQYKEKRQYKDYIAWLRGQSQDVYHEFWRNYLEGYHIENNKRNQMQKQVGQCDSHQFILPPDMESKVKDYIAQTQVTLAALIYAMWALWFYKNEAVNDVVFGITVSGRPTELAGMEAVMGVFINTVPLRIKINPSQSFHTFVSEIHKFMIQMKRYENYPLAKIKSCSNISGNNDLFDTIVVMQNYPIDKKTKGYLDIDVHKSYDHTDFKIVIGVLVWNSILFDIRYSSDAISKERIQEAEAFLLKLLQKVSENKVEDSIASFCGLDFEETNSVMNDLKELKEMDFDEIF